MFIDASALCAILLGEPEGPELARRIEGAAIRLTSAVAILETGLALLRDDRRDAQSVWAQVARALDEAEVSTVAITAREAELALQA